METDEGFQYSAPNTADIEAIKKDQQERSEWGEAVHKAGFLTQWELLDSWQIQRRTLQDMRNALQAATVDAQRFRPVVKAAADYVHAHTDVPYWFAQLEDAVRDYEQATKLPKPE